MLEAGPALLAVGVSATLGTLIGLNNGIVRYRATVRIASTGILLTSLGVGLAQRVNTSVLGVVLAAVLAWMVYRILKEANALVPQVANKHR